MSNSSITSPDPTDYKSSIISYSNTNTFYPGQTNIIRYNLTLPEDTKYYQALVNVSSSVTNDIEIVRFYISNVGSNFPCLAPYSGQPIPTYSNSPPSSQT